VAWQRALVITLVYPYDSAKSPKFPAFELSDATGKIVSSVDIFATSPVLLTFYRGGWCPYCNLDLRALQSHLKEFQTVEVALVAISPELPDQAITTANKTGLDFTVLSDVGNKIARQLGILFQLPDAMHPLFKGKGIDLKERNGDDSFQIPIPALFLVDSDGTIRHSFVDPNYTHRLEPATALELANALKDELRS
jgi:peroxiredoxin